MDFQCPRTGSQEGQFNNFLQWTFNAPERVAERVNLIIFYNGLSMPQIWDNTPEMYSWTTIQLNILLKKHFLNCGL